VIFSAIFSVQTFLLAAYIVTAGTVGQRFVLIKKRCENKNKTLKAFLF